MANISYIERNGITYTIYDRSAVHTVEAGNNSVLVNTEGANPTVSVRISQTEGNGLTLDGTGLYAAATDISGKADVSVVNALGEKVTAIENKETTWDNKQDALTADTDYATPNLVDQKITAAISNAIGALY